MSFKPRVKIHNEWATNGLAFRSAAEALASANDLMNRWLLVEDCGFVESNQEPDYEIVNGEMKAIGA